MDDLNTEFNRRLTKAFHEENEQEQDFIETVLSKIEQLQQKNVRLREEINFIKRIATGHTYVDTRRNISDQILNQIIKRIDYLEKALEAI